MTGDEMERSIEALRGSVVDLETYIEQLDRRLSTRANKVDEQMAETNKQLRIYANSLSNFIGVVTSSFGNLAATQARTDERLNALISVVEKHISEGGHGQAP